MTTQEAYETIRQTFVDQGKLARNGVGTCQYRTDEGAKCAVGALIPEELYSRRMEGMPLCTELLQNNPVLIGLLHGVDKQFLARAQLLHDSVAKDAGAFITALDVLAAASGLDTLGAAQFGELDNVVPAGYEYEREPEYAL